LFSAVLPIRDIGLLLSEQAARESIATRAIRIRVAFFISISSSRNFLRWFFSGSAV